MLRPSSFVIKAFVWAAGRGSRLDADGCFWRKRVRDVMGAVTKAIGIGVHGKSNE